MPELKLGTKYDCYNCGTKFYDLGKPEPICPKCGANQKDAVSGGVAGGQPGVAPPAQGGVAKPIDIEEDDAPIESRRSPSDEMVEPDLADADLDDEEEEDLDDED